MVRTIEVGLNVTKIGVDELVVRLPSAETVVALVGKGAPPEVTMMDVSVSVTMTVDRLAVSSADAEVALPPAEIDELFVGYGAWLVVYTIEVVETVDETVMTDTGRDEVIEILPGVKVSLSADGVLSNTVSVLVVFTG